MGGEWKCICGFVGCGNVISGHRRGCSHWKQHRDMLRNDPNLRARVSELGVKAVAQELEIPVTTFGTIIGVYHTGNLKYGARRRKGIVVMSSFQIVDAIRAMSEENVSSSEIIAKLKNENASLVKGKDALLKQLAAAKQEIQALEERDLIPIKLKLMVEERELHRE